VACDSLSSNVDYVPTILQIAGLPQPGDIEGRSMLPAIRAAVTGGPVDDVHDEVFAMYHKTQGRCIRTRTHKLIRYFDAAVDYAKVPVHLKDVLSKRGIPANEELFALENDTNEFRNVINEPGSSEFADMLRERLWRWMESVDDPLLKGPVSSPSYENSIAGYRSWKKSDDRLRRSI
jgi:arylsulfatase A-like enzyme